MPQVRREVGCLLVPRFPLACELAERPELSGLPVAVAAPNRPVVWVASPEAEADGVTDGLPLSEALARCPALAVVESRPARYQDQGETILNATSEVAADVEPGGPGVAYVEWVERLGATASARREGLLHCAPRALGPRVGVAPTKFAALVAASKAPAGQVMALDDASAAPFLAAQPVAVLPVSPGIRRRLHLIGITTLGQLRRLPRSAVTAQFGPEGGRAWSLAAGEAEPVQPRVHQERVVGSFELDEPLGSREALLAAAEQALSRAVRQPGLRGRAVRQGRLVARTESGGGYERTVTFKEPLADRARLWGVLRPYLTEARLPGPVSEVAVELAQLSPLGGRQEELFPARLAPRVRSRASHPLMEGQQARLEESLRQLKARYGYCPVGRVVAVESWSRIPERRLALIDFDL